MTYCPWQLMVSLWWLFPSTIWGRIFCQIHCKWSFPLCREFSLKGNFKAAIFLRHKVVEGVTSNEIDGILEIDLEEAIVFEDFYVWSGRESSKKYICLKDWRSNVFCTPKTIFNPPLRWLLFFLNSFWRWRTFTWGNIWGRLAFSEGALGSVLDPE